MSVLSLILAAYAAYLVTGILALIWITGRPCYEEWKAGRPGWFSRTMPLHAWPRDLVAYLRWRMHRRMWAHNKNDC